MGYVIDTSALVAFERAEASLESSLLVEEEELFVPAIVLAELWIGVELADSEERRSSRQQRIQGFLSIVGVIPFTEEIAPTYARLYALLRARGTAVPQNDLAVAATSLHLSHTLVVGPNDESHFRQVPGLEIVVVGSER